MRKRRRPLLPRLPNTGPTTAMPANTPTERAAHRTPQAASETDDFGPAYTVPDVATRLHYSEATVRRRIEEGKLAAFKDGRILRNL